MEADFAKTVIERINIHFGIYPEVWSKCGKYRIDFVLRENITGSYLGIEFKDLDKKRGEEMGEHILQSMRYSKSEFKTPEGYKKIPIFICPPISYKFLVMAEFSRMFDGKEVHTDRHDKNHEHHTVNGLLGALNMGEIRTRTKNQKQYIYFSFSNKVIWSNEIEWGTNNIKGLHKVNYEHTMNKINSFSI